MQLTKTKRLILGCVLTAIFAVGAFFALYYTVIKPANAFSTAHTTYKQVGELLKDPTSATAAKPFSYENMTTLINMIYGSSGDMNTQITSLTSTAASTPITAKTLRAKTYNKTNGQSIVVRLGGLDWIVTYVSTDTSGNLVATLWLSNNHQEAWSGITQKNIGKYCAIVQGGLYSDWSADWYADTPSSSYPSNMYGTSYIRTETLNNPNNRNYTAKDGATSLTAAASQIKTLDAHPFTLFTVSDFGLTNYITTPNQMSWINNLQTPSLRGFSTSYNLNNESLATTGGTYYSGYSYTSKTGYTNWGGDYLWLPSMVETGYNGDAAGLWETNTAERTTYDGSTTSLTASSAIGSSSNSNGSSTTAYIYSWSRSARTSNASYSYSLYPSGSDYSSNAVNSSRAVRPALLLTLNSAASHAAKPPVTITLNKEGGSGGTTEVSIAEGDAMPTLTSPAKSGYTFGGYYTAASGGGDQIFLANGSPKNSVSSFTTNTTLYAYWIPITYIVSYNANGGTGTTASSSHTYGVAKNLTSNAFSRAGYSFAGWAKSAGGEVEYTNNQSVTNLTTVNGETVTLYAIWNAAVYTITLDNQGATSAGTASVSATYGQALLSITVPTKTGYAFGGYYTAANGGGTQIYNSGGLPMISASTFTQNTTLYAKWTAWLVVTVASGSSTTEYTSTSSLDSDKESAKLTIVPKTGYIVSQISFDNTNWVVIDSCRKFINNTLIAMGITYFANENTNRLLLTFDGIFCEDAIHLYIIMTANSKYTGLKENVGGGISGFAITSTYGGTATILGADIESLGDDDTITVAADMVLDGYAFMYWMDSDGNKLSFDQSVKFKKKDVMDSVVTAVFAPIGTDPNTYVVVDNSE